MEIPEYCDECGGIVDQELRECKNCGKHFGNSKKKLMIGVAAVIVLVVVFLCAGINFLNGTTESPQTAGGNTPKNGQIIDLPPKGLTTSFFFRTGDSDYYYFVLVSKDTGDVEMSFFLHGNQNTNMPIPLGEYEIYYASGSEWFGEEVLFGEDTHYYKMRGAYKSAWAGMEPVNQTVDLHSASNDYVISDPIDAKNFPK